MRPLYVLDPSLFNLSNKYNTYHLNTFDEQPTQALLNEYNNIFLLETAVLLLLGYILSSIIWSFGKNHRRILSAVYTIIYSLITFFITYLYYAYKQWYSNEDLQGNFPNYLSIGIPLLVLIIGIILFIKEGKRTAIKKKK